MVTTKENCYQGIDRTVLIELKKLYDDLQKRIVTDKLGEIEQNVYSKLKEIFTDTLYRPFLQGDDAFTLANNIDKNIFIDAVRATIKYIKFTASSLDVDLNNLRFRLERIMQGTRIVKKEQLENEFANGHVIDIRDMSEEDYLRAAKEFSEGSKAMEQFLIYCYRNKLYTKACCIGHPCEDASMSEPYIAFDFGEKNEIKEYLISKAFENNIPIVIINFDTGLGFNLMLNPYDIEENISFLQECLEGYRGDEPINPVVDQTLKYFRKIEKSSAGFLSFCFGKMSDERVAIEERYERTGISRGTYNQEEFISKYENVIYQTPVNEFGRVNSKDVARSALNFTKQLPGRFAESMKNTLEIVKRFIGRNREDNRDEK